MRKVLKEVRTSAYKHSSNPLFSEEEAEYWDSLEYPDDEQYKNMIQMLKQIGKDGLYKKLGHDKYNAFVMRLDEDNPELYSKYIYDVNTTELPF